MALRVRLAGRSAGVTLCMFGLVAVAASLTGCAEPARPQPGHATATATATGTKPGPPSSHPRPSPPATQLLAADCLSSQLGARFVGGGFGTGNDFGEIVIWNPGTQPCRLHGPVSFTAYYADATRDRKATVNRPITAAPRTLRGRMQAPRDGKDPAGYLVAGLMGPERDDPAQPNALCRPQDEGTPASLELSIGSVAVHVTNKDSGSPQNTGIYGCHGTVLLLDLLGPSS